MNKGGKIKPKIKQYRAATLDDDHFVNVWELLRSAIEKIHANEASNLSFEELYRNAYQMVLHKKGDVLYRNLGGVLTDYLEKKAAFVSKFGSDFLFQLLKAWDDHTISMQMIRDILMYMDRTYLNVQKLPSVYELGLQLFRDVVCHSSKYPIRQRLVDSVLVWIAAERDGEVVDRRLLKSTSEMLVILGIDSNDVYIEDFERPYLDTSIEFYSRESQHFLTENDSSVYLKKVEGRLKEEEDRVKAYMDDQTKEKIQRIVERELIQNQMKKIMEMEGTGLIPMLQHNRMEDLSRMYHLFGRVEGGHEEMKKTILDYVVSCGQKVNTDPSASDGTFWVQEVISLKDKFDFILDKAFARDKNFQTSMNNGFKQFIRLNPKAPEFVSIFIDDKLKKGIKGMSEDEVDSILDKSLMLFRFLEEKDVFEKYYKNHLAKRLLFRRSISDDAERNMITKLKSECGYQFTSKLEGMFTDMRLSDDLMQGFRDFQQRIQNQNQLGMDLHVTVLTMTYWPLPSVSPKCKLPGELTKGWEIFQQFYFSRHTGRRLTWQTNMGHADLKARFAKRVHEINVSTISMAVLLLFNDSDVLSYSKIREALDIEDVELKKNLQSLACGKYKILNKNPKGREVDESDEFSFNAGFSAPLTKLKIQMIVSKAEHDQESQETQEKVEEDRKLQIEACVVRIMKSRKKLDHNNLITEVSKQLSARFLPNPNVIKRRIENLIEREYLERAPEDIRVYNYLA